MVLQLPVWANTSSTCWNLFVEYQGGHFRCCGRISPWPWSLQCADSLVHRNRLPRVAYADDFKFVSDVALCSQAEIQTEINTVADWSEEYHKPLSLDKCSVMHCGLHQPLHNYVLNSCVMKTADALSDLGVTRTSDGGYSGHCEAIFQKASRVAGAIRHVFRCRRRELMWVAFQHYVLPILMYDSPIWDPTLQRDINLLESVQRRFTKQDYRHKRVTL